MNRSILNELFLSFKKKNIYLFCILTFLILMKVYNLNISQKLENIDSSYLDSIIKIYGGIEKNALLPNLIYWISLITLLLILTRSTNEILYGFDIMILSRSNSKIKWWLSKVISSILITITYSLFIVITSYILSYVILKNNNLSKLIYYPNLGSPLKLLILSICILTTGCICIITLFQFINLIFDNNPKSYIILIIISIILCVLYENNFISRLLSPLYYPSLLDLNYNIKEILSSIVFNILSTFVNICISTIIIIKKDYSKFNS